MKCIVKIDKSLLTRLDNIEAAERLLQLIIDSNPLTNYEEKCFTDVLEILSTRNIHRRANWEYDEYESKEDYLI